MAQSERSHVDRHHPLLTSRGRSRKNCAICDQVHIFTRCCTAMWSDCPHNQSLRPKGLWPGMLPGHQSAKRAGNTASTGCRRTEVRPSLGRDCPYASYFDTERLCHPTSIGRRVSGGFGVRSPEVFDVSLTELPVDDAWAPHRPAAARDLGANVVQLGVGDT